MKKLFVLLLVGSLLLAACSSTEEETASTIPQPQPSSAITPSEPEPIPESEPEPAPEIDNSWQLDAPENHGVDPAVLEQMHTALINAPVYAVVTAKDGVIIDEYYQAGYDETSRYAFHSASKSVTSALFGIAMEEGYIDSLDDPLSKYLPQVLEQEDIRKHALTLRHLLTQTSGLEWYEWGGSYSNWNEFRSAENWVDHILGRNLVYEPGAVFNYSTGNTHLLAAALENATGRPLMDYAKEKLFDPLGMESVVWGTDPQGVADDGNGIVMTARDAARFGQLFLEGGVWNGEQLIPADWVTESTSVQNAGPGDSTGQYGYQWWVRQFGGYDCYYAFGAWGQYILVVPELNLVTAIASEGPQNSYASRAYFTDYILPACGA
ncbi:serine hydrolase [Anaerotruncus sp.]|uniref:serine hydrolase domain-containing protein n=1 Tax=Anaerotruncus sp. TaxID=1872531 RepID=UPI00216C13C7|nr:serine hydrolase [Anaerotruncus sp.]MCI8493112.1 serine hydrolase [Anaerotruncus sp.]